MKYPPHLYTIVIDFGPSIPFFQQHHTDVSKARKTFYHLRDKATKSRGTIENIQLWHNNAIISAYTSNHTTATWLPPPDADGITRIPEARRAYKPVNASALSAWERYGKPSEMAGKVPKGTKKPKHLPSTIITASNGTTFKLEL